VLTGSAPARFEGGGAVERVVLAAGRVLDCSVAVVGIGVRPRTELAARAGLLVVNGIVATKRLETSVPSVYGVGDVVSAHHPFYGRRLRVEHWRERAQSAGRGRVRDAGKAGLV
jgi:3-phenylpropionate/trans-cinnamate dioxygenase ferredoxin reductase subunit